MAKNRKIPKPNRGQKESGFLSAIEKKIQGFDSPSHEDPCVNLKYYDKSYQCFSEWQTDELKSFSSFVEKLAASNWTDILKSGGKSGQKKGFGMTYHKDRNNLPASPILKKISEDIKFFELRVTQKARVHGFRSYSSFFLVWLDRNHQIYPQ